MSKRVQTTNLNLYAYENLRGLPTFLKDWSDNMLILDGAYVTVNGLISALDTRITTAEGTLEDLSPESIEDYKIRLDALEKKVVINTNAIKDVNTRIGTINAQINSINVEQGVQNSRLTALEGVTANHTTQINSMIGDISSVTGRVTTLEQCCETVQHEIADMQSDIDGFNDDLTVLATQFETVSGVVSELTDLVNSLQLDVVSQRLDTFESDLDALTASVTSLGGRMTDAENQIELNGNAINENALDIANIESEMGNTDYSEVGNTVSSAIVELADRIRNLTPQEYDTLVQAIQDAEQEIDDIQALIPDDATSSNKLITLNDVVIPSVNIASANRAGIVKVGQRLSVQSDGTLDADNQIGDSSYGLVKSVNDNASAITSINSALVVSDPNEGNGLISFGVDSSGNYGYKKVGADTVIPFKTSDGYSYAFGERCKCLFQEEHFNQSPTTFQRITNALWFLDKSYKSDRENSNYLKAGTYNIRPEFIVITQQSQYYSAHTVTIKATHGDDSTTNIGTFTVQHVGTYYYYYGYANEFSVTFSKDVKNIEFIFDHTFVDANASLGRVIVYH